MGPHENNVSAQTKPSRTPSNPEEHPDNFWKREPLPATPQNTNTQNLQGCAGIQHRGKKTTPMAKEMNRKMSREETDMTNGYS